jgi:cell division septation protein DedD
MITIKFSTVKDPASAAPQKLQDGELQDEALQDGDEQDDETRQRIPVAWIAATLGLGLLIAAFYLKGRIWTSHPHAAPNPPQVVMRPRVQPPVIKPESPPEASKPVQAEIPPAQQPGEPEAPVVEHPFVGPTLQEVAASEQGISLITPHPGERYIQVGAFNEAATRRFVEHLQHESKQPHVAAGPTPQILRVLIGPFDDPEKLAEEKKRLETQGVDTFVRKY